MDGGWGELEIDELFINRGRMNGGRETVNTV